MIRPAMLLCLVPCTVLPGAEEPARPQVALEEFMGGTGGTVAALVRGYLAGSGRVELSGTIGRFLVRASSSAGRIDGALLATDGNVIFNRQYDSTDLRDNAQAFADDVMEAVTGDRGIAASRIAFVSDRSGAREIYMCDADGQRVRQLTRGGSVSVSPSLGPGALFLTHTGYDSGFADVFLTDLRDGSRRKIISAPGTNSGAAFSSDGTRLALSMSHEGDPDIYVTLMGGGHGRRLTQSKSVEFSPAWAPDGQRLVFCSDATGAPQLYLCSRRGGAPERLETGISRCTGPDWSSDGRRIAFTAWRGKAKAVAIYDLESGRTEEKLAGAEDPSWAPDARHLAAVRGGSLLVLDVVTGKSQSIVSGMGRVSEPAWSK